VEGLNRRLAVWWEAEKVTGREVVWWWVGGGSTGALAA
jgi:hypothetical protein